jgi:hypothetical protein
MVQHLAIAGWNNFRACDDIIMDSIRRRDDDMVAGADEAQRPETRVAVGGDSGVSMMAWETRGTWRTQSRSP